VKDKCCRPEGPTDSRPPEEEARGTGQGYATAMRFLVFRRMESCTVLDVLLDGELLGGMCTTTEWEAVVKVVYYSAVISSHARWILNQPHHLFN